MDWLNSGPQDHVKRIAEMLRQMQFWADLLPNPWTVLEESEPAAEFGPKKNEDPTIADFFWPYVRKNLGAQLDQFTFRPAVNLVRSVKGKKGALHVSMVPRNWSPKRPNDKELLQGVWPSHKTVIAEPPDVQEAFMVSRLIQSAQDGEVGRIRECKCDRWLVAKRGSHRFCSPACRKKFFVPTEESKERRKATKRKYMKNFMRSSRLDKKRSEGMRKAIKGRL